MAHAELGASSASRWMACPGSVALSRGQPSVTSEFARTGTVAHTLGEHCLAGGYSPRQFLGQPIDINHPDILVDDEMVEAVTVYTSLGQTLKAEAVRTGGKFLLEQRVDLAKLGGPGEHMFGTADLIGYFPRDGSLLVYDYKHGSGIPVEVERNPQLLFYALGALLSVMPAGTKVRRVSYGVVQPRCEHPDGPVRVTSIELLDLLEWSDDLIEAAEATQQFNAPVVPGSHCRFCPAQAVCPEVRRQKMDQAKMVFADTGRIEAATVIPLLSLDEVRNILDSADDITAWVKSVKEYAQARLEAGMDMPGWKLVPKRPTREWSLPEAEVADWLCERYGLGDEDLYIKKFVSPAQVEKVLKADKKTKGEIAALVSMSSSGTTLAPGSDPRPAVTGTRPSAQDVFSGLD